MNFDEIILALFAVSSASLITTALKVLVTMVT